MANTPGRINDNDIDRLVAIWSDYIHDRPARNKNPEGETQVALLVSIGRRLTIISNTLADIRDQGAPPA
ncbi:MAG TPA: hypothetical protein VG268_17000 [Streptosporangiaceae bacterium]|jgi:hypothetical protein|nr:hypothetical protein [Streptosporangiaceae bacterium]